MKRLLLLIFVRIPVAFVIFSVALVFLYRFLPVVATPLMLKRSVEFREDDTFHTRKRWVPIEKISSNLVKSVIASEDNRFETHNGFDFEEIRKMTKDHREKGKRIRGCSTISQQTAKNCFTFCSDTWSRKAVEAYWTVLIELIWGKERIMEVYLNVIEMGKGIYGAEAAARTYFDTSAAKLTASQSALLAACLPNPLKMSPAKPSAYVNRRRSAIMAATGRLLYPDWVTRDVQ